MSKTTTLRKPKLVSKTSEAALAFAEARQDTTDLTATARLNANIPVELHRALKVRAASEGKTIGELVENWIKSWAK